MIETLTKILILVASIVAIFIFISIAINFFNIFYKQEVFEGDKDFVAEKIIEHIYKCYQDNYPRKVSKICYEFIIKSFDDIDSSYIINLIDEKKIDKNNLEIDNVPKNSNIIIRYENGKIYVKVKVKEVLN